MMRPIVATVLALLVSETTAHFMFSRLIVNKTTSAEWKYIRDVAQDIASSRPEDAYTKTYPQFDIYNTNITCGRSAFLSAAKTETADIIAGDEVGFRLSKVTDPGGEYSAEIFHEGPAQIYLAKADKELKDFSGIGEEANWFKIASFASKSDTEWKTYLQNSDVSYDCEAILTKLDKVNFTIPASTPPGKYLMRIEQFWPTSTFNYTQWFVNCAHVNIIGSGGGSLQGYEYAKFPGTYDIMDPGLWIPYEMTIFKGLSKYVAPGPVVWKG